MVYPHKPNKSFWSTVSPFVERCYRGSAGAFLDELDKLKKNASLRNIDLQYGDEKWTLLHLATMRGGPEGAYIAKRLLELGANEELKDSEGFTAEGICRYYEQEKLFSDVFNFSKKRSSETYRGRDAMKDEGANSKQKRETVTSDFKGESDKEEYKASGVFAAKNSKIIEFLESKGEEQTEADRTNIERLKELNPISQAWVLAKTIAGMANNEGGKIFLGVNNSGKIVGLGRDFAAEGLDKLKGMERWDKYEIRLRERIECMFKNRAVAGVLFKLTPEKSGEKDYFKISIEESITPIFICKEPKTKTWKKTLSPDEFKEFYLRRGGATKRVPYKEAEEYIKTRFPGYSE